MQVAIRRTSNLPLKAAATGSLSLSDPLFRRRTHSVRKSSRGYTASNSSYSRSSEARWIRVLEPLLPQGLRKYGDKSPKNQISKEETVEIIGETLLEARRKESKDILHYLISVENRWDAFLWICAVLIESPMRNKSNFLSTIRWTDEETLDEYTGGEKPTTTIVTPVPIKHPRLGTAPDQTGLSAATQDAFSTSPCVPLNRERQYVGQVCQSLGNLIIEIQTPGSSKQGPKLDCAIKVLRKLRYHGYVSEKVLRFMFANAKRVSSEATSIEDSPKFLDSFLPGETYASSQYDDDYSPENFDVNPTRSEATILDVTLGPDRLLELCIWCCVEEGWLNEGFAILKALKLRNRSNEAITGDEKTSNCVTSTGTQTEVNNDNKHQPSSKARQSNTGQPSWLSQCATNLTNAINAMVNAFIDVLTPETTSAASGFSVMKTLANIQDLKSMLSRFNLGLGDRTWDSAMARFSELPEVSIENNPGTMHQILDLPETYGNEMDTVNGFASQTTDYESPAWIFDGSAAVIGLYHRILYAYIRARDVNGAFDLFKQLQLLTDQNKSKLSGDFFKRLKSTDAPHSLPSNQQYDTKTIVNQFNDQSASLQPGGLFPDLPLPTLAALLDLITESGLFDLGRWMIHSDELDGPLISPELYGNQVLAPAVIRFAVATSDTSLLRDLVRAQSVSLSGRTLIAFCESRIEVGNWEGALSCIAMIRDQTLHAWTAVDFATILRALLRHLKEPLDQSSEQARETLQKLLRGDLGHLWGTRFSQLDTIVALLMDISPSLIPLLADLLIHGSYQKLDLPVEAFDLILEGAVKVHGSVKGQSLWRKWCEGDGDDHDYPVAGESVIGPSHVTTQFSAEDLNPLDPDEAARRRKATLHGKIKPTLRTLRIIAQQALLEVHTMKPEEGTTSSHQVKNLSSANVKQSREILDWVVMKLQTDFSMSRADIDYELEGFLSSLQPSDTIKGPYSSRTLSIWRSLGISRKQWISMIEDRLRNFAIQSTEQRQLVLDPVPRPESIFIHCLAEDLGLDPQSYELRGDWQVSVSKPARARLQIPSTLIEEAATWYFQKRGNSVT